MYLHSTEKAREFATKALDRIQQEKLIPTPENYELWYVYYSAVNPELSRALEIAIKNNAVNETICTTLYQQFLSGTREDETVRQAGDQIKKTIEEVNGAVTSVKEFTLEYGKNLENVNDQLQVELAKEQVSKEELNDLINGVITDTQQMMDQNARLENLLENSTQAIETLRRDLELARKEAMIDGLTNLVNRKTFDTELERIAREFAEDDTGGHHFVLLMLDIDHFKKFNDTFGHQVGDQVLKLVAKSLKEGVKGRDVAARYGGEEFGIILPGTALQGGLKVAELLRQEVEKKEVINRSTGERLARITLSAGVAEYIKGETLEAFIARADAALYAAKQNGRNQVAAASDQIKKKLA